jgi:ribosomal protein L40E
LASEFIYCMECGARLPGGARFCNVCGTKILQPEAPEPAQAATPEPPGGEEAESMPDETALVGEPAAEHEPALGSPAMPVDEEVGAGEWAAPAAAATAETAAADSETEEKKWVWGDSSTEEEPAVEAVPAGGAVAASAVAGDQPPAALEQGDEIVETRRYPPGGPP